MSQIVSATKERGVWNNSNNKIETWEDDDKYDCCAELESNVSKSNIIRSDVNILPYAALGDNKPDSPIRTFIAEIYKLEYDPISTRKTNKLIWQEVQKSIVYLGMQSIQSTSVNHYIQDIRSQKKTILLRTHQINDPVYIESNMTPIMDYANILYQMRVLNAHNALVNELYSPFAYPKISLLCDWYHEALARRNSKKEKPIVMNYLRLDIVKSAVSYHNCTARIMLAPCLRLYSEAKAMGSYNIPNTYKDPHIEIIICEGDLLIFNMSDESCLVVNKNIMRAFILYHQLQNKKVKYFLEEQKKKATLYKNIVQYTYPHQD